jgi:hypothetical protein
MSNFVNTKPICFSLYPRDIEYLDQKSREFGYRKLSPVLCRIVEFVSINYKDISPKISDLFHIVRENLHIDETEGKDRVVRTFSVTPEFLNHLNNLASLKSEKNKSKIIRLSILLYRAWEILDKEGYLMKLE